MKFNPDGISLKATLIVFFAGVTILTVGLVGLLSFYSGRQAVSDVALHLRSEIIGHINEHAEEYLLLPQRINQANARAIGLESGLAGDQEALVARFAEQVDLFPTITSINFGNAAGGLANSGRDPLDDSRYVIVTDGFQPGTFRKIALESGATHGREMVVLPDFDARTRSWHARALAEGGPVYNDIYVIFTGQDMSLAVSRPVYDRQGKVLGVVSVDLFLSHLSRFLQGLRIGTTGQAFIMERSGELVASSRGKVLLVDDASQSRRVRGEESEEPAIREAVSALIGRFEGLRHIQGDEYLDFEVNGRMHYLQAAPLRVAPGIDWLVAVAVPEADFMAGMAARNRTTILLTLGALALALLSGTLMARGIVRPINLLDRASTKLTSDSHSEEIEEKSWFAEVRSLTSSFNLMSRKLSGSIQALNAELAERKRTQAELQNQRLRLVNIINSTNVATWEWNVQSGEHVIDDRWAEIIGYFLQELEPVSIQTWEKNVHPEDLKNVGQLLDLHFAGKIPYFDHEYRMQHKDGHWVWVRDQGQIVTHAAEGTPLVMYGTLSDITERRYAEEKLKHSERTYREIFNAITDALFIHDVNTGDILDVNDSMLHLYGYDRDELPGLSVADLSARVVPYTNEEAAKLIKRAAAGETVIFEWHNRKKNGDLFYSENILKHVVIAGQQRIMAIVRDITDRKQAEVALIQAKS